MELGFWFVLALAATLISTYMLGRAVGKRSGIKAENARALYIMHQALMVRFSFTLRMVCVCIAGNQTLEEMVEELARKD